MLGSDEGVKPVPKFSDQRTSSLLQNACALELLDKITTRNVNRERNLNKNFCEIVKVELIMINWFVE